MPFLAYVHARDPDPSDDPRRTWEPNWRVWRWVLLAVVLGFASARSDRGLGAVLALLVFACACQAAAELYPKGDGLREYRQ